MMTYEPDTSVIGSPPSGGGNLSQFFPQHQQIPSGVQLPTFGSSPSVAATAAKTGGLASMFNPMSLLQLAPSLMSMFGAATSGSRAKNKAETAILEELLKQFQSAAPIRSGVQSSMLGRLPDYMRQNFPTSMQGVAGERSESSGLAQVLARNKGNSPRFPNY